MKKLTIILLFVCSLLQGQVPFFMSVKQINTCVCDTSDTVHIGSQIWMNCNLNYNDGGVGIYPSTDTCELGYLYTKEAAERILINFPGWRLPKNADITYLYVYYGSVWTFGGHFKEEGTTYWKSPNTDADNSAKFNGRAADFYYGESTIFSKNGLYIWREELSGENGLCIYLFYNSNVFGTASVMDLENGASIRLIKNIE
jgi:uncharacterized protein (TIGR02145 family)